MKHVLTTCYATATKMAPFMMTPRCRLGDAVVSDWEIAMARRSIVECSQLVGPMRSCVTLLFPGRTVTAKGSRPLRVQER